MAQISILYQESIKINDSVLSLSFSWPSNTECKLVLNINNIDLKYAMKKS